MTGKTQNVIIKGTYASELYIYSMCAADEGGPTVVLRGDKLVCENRKKLYPWLETTAVKEGFGSSVKSIAPARTKKLIYEGAKKALSQDFNKIPLALPKTFDVTLEYKEHYIAKSLGYFPNVTQLEIGRAHV